MATLTKTIVRRVAAPADGIVGRAGNPAVGPSPPRLMVRHLRSMMFRAFIS